MHCYGGLVVIMIYASLEQAEEQIYALITQSGIDIFTQSSEFILAQVP